jgi:glycosyltransferase involved in cell wall biosynthesis
VGGGPDKKKLEQIAESTSIEFNDWLSYDKLPELYSAADCFILPSNFEPWGLVVNEAMSAGLPIILSDKVGALPDLLEENKNGWKFNSDSEDELVEILNKLNNFDKENLKEMGRRSQKIIDNYSCAAWAQIITSKW